MEISSTAKNVREEIARLPEGQCILSAAFLDCGPRASVDQALSRLVKSKELLRLTRGLFMKPKTNHQGSQSMQVAVNEVFAPSEGTFEHEKAQMELHGFRWDPSHQGYARWTHYPSGITALRQPYMRDVQWEEHKDEKCKEAGEATEVFLVADVSKQLDREASGYELFISDWFKKAHRFVDGRGRWFILSAEHGLLDPSKVIAPYSRSLNTMSRGERLTWGANLVKQIAIELPYTKNFTVMAGTKYCEVLVDYLLTSRGEANLPLEGLKIHEQLEFLKDIPANPSRW